MTTKSDNFCKAHPHNDMQALHVISPFFLGDDIDGSTSNGTRTLSESIMHVYGHCVMPTIIIMTTAAILTSWIIY